MTVTTSSDVNDMTNDNVGLVTTNMDVGMMTVDVKNMAYCAILNERVSARRSQSERASVDNGYEAAAPLNSLGIHQLLNETITLATTMPPKYTAREVSM